MVMGGHNEDGLRQGGGSLDGNGGDNEGGLQCGRNLCQKQRSYGIRVWCS